MEIKEDRSTTGRMPHESLVRVQPEPSSEGRQPPRLKASTLIWVSAALGLATGLAEVLYLVVQHALAATSVLGGLQMNRHFPWMIPLTHLAIFSTAGLSLLIVSRMQPRLVANIAYSFFIFLSLFSLLLLVKGLHIVAAALLAMGVARTVHSRTCSMIHSRGKYARAVAVALIGVLCLLGGRSYVQLVLAERINLASLPPARPGAPNVLLVVMDTVRADRLSQAGYFRKTTPNLDALARRGVAFKQARSTAPWTLPSHASMFTGRLPSELGMSASRPLGRTYPTIAEFLAGHGYATAGFVGNTYFCNSWYGLARGFAHYEDYYEDNIIISPFEAFRCSALGRLILTVAGGSHHARPGTINALKDGPRVNRDFLGWLDERGDRPFFAFLNYIDAHDPYQVQDPKHPPFGTVPQSSDDVALIQNWHQHDKKNVSEAEKTLLSDAYDDCLALLDRHLGELFAELERRGCLKNTYVIITSDHGETFGEHGLYLHGQSLYRPEVHVPLIIRGPSGVPEGTSVTTPVSLANLASTITDQLGLSDSSPFPGRSLASLWRSDRGAPHEDDPVISEVAVKEKPTKKPNPVPAMRGPMVSALRENRVLIRDAQGTEELFDIESDPDEAINLINNPEEQGVLHRLRQDLARSSQKAPAR